jgi:ketosteroid isomerase-like protein
VIRIAAAREGLTMAVAQRTTRALLSSNVGGSDVTETENVQLIGTIYEAFGRGDIAHIVEQLTDDVRWVSHFESIVPWSGDYSGKATVPGFFEAIASSVDVTAFNPGQFVAQGDTVVSLGEFGCRVRSTGKSAVTPFVFIRKLRAGRVYSYEQFHDPSIADAFR